MNRVGAWLKIRPGEGRAAVLAVGLMLTTSAGMGFGGSAVEALLFARQGVSVLPYLFMILGGLTLVVSLAVTVLLGRLPQRAVYLAMPLALAALLAVERALIAFDFDWLYPFMWLAMMVTGALQGLFTWGLAGASLDTRQAKRLFPLFGAGGILGMVLGGLLTRPLVQVLHAENLLLVWALLLLAVYGFGRALTAGAPRRARRPRGAPPPNFLREMQQGFQFVRRSPLLVWLSWAAVTFAVLYSSVSFPFAKAATASFPDEDALTGFFGLFQGLSTGAAFLASLFLANRLYARFGLPRALLTLALIYLAGFGLLAAGTYGGSLIGGAALLSIFPLLVGFRFTQIAWVNGVAAPAYQALLNVAPPERRDQVRAFIDGVPGQAGIVIAGVVLLVGETILQPEHLYLIGLAAAGLTAYIAWQAGRAYGGALVEALRAGHPQLFFEEEEPFGGFRRDGAALAAAVAGLSHADPVVRRVAAETLGNLAAPEATGPLVQALADADAQVRAGALRALARANAASALLDVALCLDDPEPEVRRRAVEAVARLAAYPRGVAARIRPLLADAAPLVRAQAALELLRAGPDEAARDLLRTMAAMGDMEERVCALEALGEWGDVGAFDFVLMELEDAAAPPTVRRVAAQALVRIDPAQATAGLVRALGDDDTTVRAAAARGLGSLGGAALDAVIAALFDSRLEAGALLALERLPAANASRAIRAYAKAAAGRALHYHDLGLHVEGHGARQRAGLPPEDDCLRLLVQAVQSQALRHGRHALRAVGVLAGGDSLAVALDNLDSRSPAQRANALETLEAVDGRWRDYVRPLLRLWEPAEGSAKNGLAADDGVEHLRELLADPDDWVRACAALAAVHAAPDAGLRELLENAARFDADEVVRETAGAILARPNGEPGMKTLATLSVMERILFLRRVPLFVDLAPADLKQVAAAAYERLLTDGETIAQKGESGEEMYVITSGQVRVLAGDGGEVARRGAGEYVGEMAIISQEPRMASLVASGDVRLLCLGRVEFEQILRERPEAGLAVMRVLIERLKEAQGSNA